MHNMLGYFIVNAGAEALGAQGDVVQPWAGDTWGVFSEVKVIFHGKTLVGIVRQTLDVVGMIVCGTVGAADGGATVGTAGSS